MKWTITLKVEGLADQAEHLLYEVSEFKLNADLGDIALTLGGLLGTVESSGYIVKPKGDELGVLESVNLGYATT